MRSQGTTAQRVPQLIDCFFMSAKRDNAQVIFAKGIQVWVMTIDGAWQSECKMLAVSERGALLQVNTSLALLQRNEFFLVLSENGVAFRRSRMVWVDGEKVGVEFIGGDKGGVSRPRPVHGLIPAAAPEPPSSAWYVEID